MRLLPLIVLLACSGPDPDDTGPVDADGDGFVAADDCNDQDPAVSPGAEERCNGVDDDCDGKADDEDDDVVDASWWYPDEDRDGVGVEEGAIRACRGTAGWAEDAGDCDDTDPEVQGHGPWYADADEDGWGDVNRADTSCEMPSGYVDVDGDCDDGDPSVYPDADDPLDAVDHDCDGTAREVWSDLLDLRVAAGAATFGGGLTGGDLTGDGAADLLVLDEASTPDESRLLLLEAPFDATTAAIAPPAGAGFLTPLVAPADLDGDGLPDLAVLTDDGATTVSALLGPFDEDRSVSDASVSLLLTATDVAVGGVVDGGDLLITEVGDAVTVRSWPWESVSLTLTSDPDRRLGDPVAWAGDLDGDGLSDVLVGDWYDADGDGFYVVLGGTTGEGTVADLASARVSSGNDNLGYALAGVGDLDGDGRDDLGVGAPNHPTGDTTRGAVFLFRTPLDATGPSDAEGRLEMDLEGWALGRKVQPAGDVDADGSPDLLLCEPGADGRATGGGICYLMDGATDGVSAVSEEAILVMGRKKEALGTAAVGALDLDGDGVDDLALGAPGAKAVFVLFGGW